MALREAGQAVYDELDGRVQADDSTGSLAVLVEASTLTIDDVWEVATTRFPLETLFDPDVCPTWALGYCAGVHGVLLPELASYATPAAWEAAARALIADRPARRRGTRRALIAAAQAIMEPGALVDIARRTNPDSPGVDSPYDLVILTRGALAEPSLGTIKDVVLAAAEPHRVRGHVFHHRLITGTTWRDLQLAGTTWKQLQDAGVTWADLQSGAFTP